MTHTTTFKVLHLLSKIVFDATGLAKLGFTVNAPSHAVLDAAMAKRAEYLSYLDAVVALAKGSYKNFLQEREYALAVAPTGGLTLAPAGQKATETPEPAKGRSDLEKLEEKYSTTMVSRLRAGWVDTCEKHLQLEYKNGRYVTPQSASGSRDKVKRDNGKGGDGKVKA